MLRIASGRRSIGKKIGLTNSSTVLTTDGQRTQRHDYKAFRRTVRPVLQLRRQLLRVAAHEDGADVARGARDGLSLQRA